MKIIRLTKRLGRTINTGNYNSVTIQAEATIEFDSDHESYEGADKELFEHISLSLANDRKRIKEKRQGVTTNGK